VRNPTTFATTSLLLKATSEVAHRVLVRKLHDGTFGTSREHHLGVLSRDPWNHA
jgi:hypothetical protein